MPLWTMQATWLCVDAALAHISNRCDSASHLSKTQPRPNKQLAQFQNKVLPQQLQCSYRYQSAQTHVSRRKRTTTYLIMVANLVVDGKSKRQYNSHHNGDPVSHLAPVGLPLVLEVGPGPAVPLPSSESVELGSGCGWFASRSAERGARVIAEEAEEVIAFRLESRGRCWFIVR